MVLVAGCPQHAWHAGVGMHAKLQAAGGPRLGLLQMAFGGSRWAGCSKLSVVDGGRLLVLLGDAIFQLGGEQLEQAVLRGRLGFLRVEAGCDGNLLQLLQVLASFC